MRGHPGAGEFQVGSRKAATLNGNLSRGTVRRRFDERGRPLLHPGGSGAQLCDKLAGFVTSIDLARSRAISGWSCIMGGERGLGAVSAQNSRVQMRWDDTGGQISM